MKDISKIAENIFSISLFIALIGGGLVALLFIISLIIRGDNGEALAVITKSNILPWFIRIASISVLSGLIQLYTSGEHALSMDSGKKKD